MKKGTPIFFLRKRVNFDGPPNTVQLERVPAVYIAESEPVCKICLDPEQGHSKPKRVHAFEPTDPPGSTIDIHYSNDNVERRYYVQHGEIANGWIEKS